MPNRNPALAKDQSFAHGPRTQRLHPILRKILVSVKFVSASLGPEMAAPILWTPGKMRPFCRKNHVHKIPRFRGGGYFGFGGGSADFTFMGAGIFLKYRTKLGSGERFAGISQLQHCIGSISFCDSQKGQRNTEDGRLIFMHLQRREVLPFLTIQRQRTSQHWRCLNVSLPEKSFLTQYALV